MTARAAAPAGLLDIRVVPRASRNAIDGVRDGRVLVRVTAAPADGAANEAVIQLLSAACARPASAFRILRGDRSRNKTIVVSGITSEELRARLAAT